MEKSGVIFGGTPLVAVCEEYDGTNWTESGDLPAGQQFGGGVGTQTAALSFGGFTGPTTTTTATNKYDGTSWTATSALATAKARSQGAGTQTAAVAAGGVGPGHTTVVNTTEEWTIAVALKTVTDS